MYFILLKLKLSFGAFKKQKQNPSYMEFPLNRKKPW